MVLEETFLKKIITKWAG